MRASRRRESPWGWSGCWQVKLPPSRSWVPQPQHLPPVHGFFVFCRICRPNRFWNGSVHEMRSVIVHPWPVAHRRPNMSHVPSAPPKSIHIHVPSPTSNSPPILLPTSTSPSIPPKTPFGGPPGSHVDRVGEKARVCEASRRQPWRISSVMSSTAKERMVDGE